MPISKIELQLARTALNEAYNQSPGISSASFLSENTIEVLRSIKCPQLGKSTQISGLHKIHCSTNNTFQLKSTGFWNNTDSSVLATAHSPSRDKKAVFRKLEGDTEFVLEIFDKYQLISHQLKISGKHRAVCTNLCLTTAALSWSENGNKILYLAESLPKKGEL